LPRRDYARCEAVFQDFFCGCEIAPGSGLLISPQELVARPEDGAWPARSAGCNAPLTCYHPAPAIPPPHPEACMLLFSRRAALALPLLAATSAWAAADADNTVILTTKNGKVVIRLRPDWASKHVAQIKALVKRGFYDGIVFHRVIPGFMAQTGDPTGTGTGGSDLPNLPAEFNQTHFTRGILGMARSEDPDSANSQFFIVFGDAGFLDGKYTAFGEVVSGMDVVDKIKAGTEANNGQVTNPDKIVTMRMASASK
jgi:peptidylprolyl isomerase